MDDRSAPGCVSKSSGARHMGTRRLNDIPSCSRVRREQGKTKKGGGGRRPGSSQSCQDTVRCAACRKNHTCRARTRSGWGPHQLSRDVERSRSGAGRLAPYPQQVGGRAALESPTDTKTKACARHTQDVFRSCAAASWCNDQHGQAQRGITASFGRVSGGCTRLRHDQPYHGQLRLLGAPA